MKSLDLSGVENENLSGLVLPNITDATQPILLPGGTTYSDGSVTNTENVTEEQLGDELLALKNANKTISSVSFPDGSSYTASSGALVLNSSEKVLAVCEAVGKAGMTLNSRMEAYGRMVR